MTFIVGLTCIDGILLCSDSLEDNGVSKKLVGKITPMGAGDWGLAIAGAGPGPTIDKFNASIRKKLAVGEPDQDSIESLIEQELSDFNSKYVHGPGDGFVVIVGLYCPTDGQRLLYRGSCLYGDSSVLSPTGSECHTGTGSELWRLVADTLYNSRNSVADNARLAVFATRLAIKFASGVGPPVQLISYTFGENFWRIYNTAEIALIEGELPLDQFQKSIQRYWRQNNPPTTSEQVIKYGGTRTPEDELTLLEGVKLEELYTVAGRQRASRIFRHNTDKLQQRAILEGKRYRSGKSSA
jgi:hypothetical protein